MITHKLFLFSTLIVISILSNGNGFKSTYRLLQQSRAFQGQFKTNGEIDMWPMACTANNFKLYLLVVNYLKGTHRATSKHFLHSSSKIKWSIAPFRKKKQDITIDNYVHRRLGLIKENSDYSWSTNLICHCFPLLSTSFANLKHGRTTEKNIYRSKGETGRTKNRPSYLIILLHTSRIDLTSGFCSWNSLRKSSLANKDITQLGTGNGTRETCSFPI